MMPATTAVESTAAMKSAAVESTAAMKSSDAVAVKASKRRRSAVPMAAPVAKTAMEAAVIAAVEARIEAAVETESERTPDPIIGRPEAVIASIRIPEPAAANGVVTIRILRDQLILRRLFAAAGLTPDIQRVRLRLIHD